MGFNLERFKKAQEKDYSRAMEEIRKVTGCGISFLN